MLSIYCTCMSFEPVDKHVKHLLYMYVIWTGPVVLMFSMQQIVGSSPGQVKPQTIQ
jgi:hypothetical protein